MASTIYKLNVDYPCTEEEIQTFRKTLGTEYLKLMREYVMELETSNAGKREIAELIQIRLKSKYCNNKKNQII